MASVVTLPKTLPLLEGILIPGSTLRIPIESSQDVELVRSCINEDYSNVIVGVCATQPNVLGEPGAAVHPIGTAGVVVSMQINGGNWPQASYTLYITGVCRFQVKKLSVAHPYRTVDVTQLDRFGGEADDDDPEVQTLVESFREDVRRMVRLMDATVPPVAKLKRMLNTLPGAHLTDLSASVVMLSNADKLRILDTLDVAKRVNILRPLVSQYIKNLELNQSSLSKSSNQPSMTVVRLRIPSQPMSNRQDNWISLARNKQELGDDLEELQNKLDNSQLPTHAYNVASKELQRLKRMSALSPEAGIIRSYVELFTELPWGKVSPETLDVIKARQDLDADHYAMNKVKRRLLEYLAVRQLKNSLRGPILCFVGPPGVGKTSIGRSIAHTLGREFCRISLGGVSNQSDIRGHRRTYIGSMPGRILQGIRTVGVNNPVILLDEIDKLGTAKGNLGDPASAMLEVLDPEQNCNFVDHYLNVPFDLSQVMFIATANSIKTIPPALRDRMEVIHVPGYTQEEKLHIATRHLLPKQLKEHGLTSDIMLIPDTTMQTIISKYTLEAGVRSLERRLAALCRDVAVKVAEKRLLHKTASSFLPVIIDIVALEDILGPPFYLDNELWSRVGRPGVAVGLAWSTTGAQVMIVEVSKMEGTGELILTGYLGRVMKESAKIALNWVRTAAIEYGIKLDRKIDLHIHFPMGAVVKDGPSAGITIATALMSLFANRPVATDVAMTGEITLTGMVVPVGGVRDKVLAAHRAGLKRVILPRKCKMDLIELADNVKRDLVFYFVDHVDDVLQAAFEGGFSAPTNQQSNDQLISKL